jgi:hypothetical protein
MEWMKKLLFFWITFILWNTMLKRWRNH